MARRTRSADVGATVRGVLLSPKTGFAGAFRRIDATPEKPSSYLLAGVGGAAAMLLWLKVSGLFGLREGAAGGFRWSIFLPLLVLSGLVAVLARALWSVAAPRVAGPEAASPRTFRAVWSLSSFPQVAVVLVLLPLDLILVGGKAFTAEPIGDSVSTAWAALSTAIALSLSVWSGAVFFRGVEAAGRASLGRSAAIAGLAVASVVVVVAVAGFALVALKGAGG